MYTGKKMSLVFATLLLKRLRTIFSYPDMRAGTTCHFEYKFCRKSFTLKRKVAYIPHRAASRVWKLGEYHWVNVLKS